MIVEFVDHAARVSGRGNAFGHYDGDATLTGDPERYDTVVRDVFGYARSGKEHDGLLRSGSEAEDLAVDIRVIVREDRTVERASIVDESRYARDDRYRAAAESALRAVRDPRCSPLNLPPEKYSLWRDMIVTFDPKDML